MRPFRRKEERQAGRQEGGREGGKEGRSKQAIGPFSEFNTSNISFTKHYIRFRVLNEIITTP